MREIKFRGKTIIGYWVHGDLFRYGDSEENCRWSINEWHPVDGWTDYHVRPDTVGQYTGLKDKDGREIYEGDIILADTNSASPVYAQVRWDGRVGGFQCFGLTGVLGGEYTLADFVEVNGSYKVVGNIFDNRDLIEELERKVGLGPVHVEYLGPKPEQQKPGPIERALKRPLEADDKFLVSDGNGGYVVKTLEELDQELGKRLLEERQRSEAI